jgi:hypothetical protein
VAGSKQAKNQPVDEAALAADCERFLTALAERRASWGTAAQLGFPSSKKRSALIVKRLLDERRIVPVGKVKGAEAYTLLGNESNDERLATLAERLVAEQINIDKLDLLPLAVTAKRYAGIPVRIRRMIVPALQQAVLRKRAVPTRVGRSNYVALVENLHALVALSPAARPQSAAIDPRPVLRAYEELAQKSRSPNIIVSELQQQSGVELGALQGWLLAECRAQRAVPLLGEPAHATPEQLAAALVVEGRPHLYVRLLQEQRS